MSRHSGDASASLRLEIRRLHHLTAHLSVSARDEARQNCDGAHVAGGGRQSVQALTRRAVCRTRTISAFGRLTTASGVFGAAPAPNHAVTTEAGIAGLDRRWAPRASARRALLVTASGRSRLSGYAASRTGCCRTSSPPGPQTGSATAPRPCMGRARCPARWKASAFAGQVDRRPVPEEANATGRASPSMATSCATDCTGSPTGTTSTLGTDKVPEPPVRSSPAVGSRVQRIADR